MQFTIYTSVDVSGPGMLTGQVGTLVTLLDACLVNGYTGKAAAGWTKPVVNSGNCGSYTQGAGGSGLSLFINDNGPNVTSTFKEAWAVGWETITALTAPTGAGRGPFPWPSQITNGRIVCRKSVTADGTGRHWILFADALTFYLYILNGDSAGVYAGNLFFGDIYSYEGATDTHRCMIIGQASENTSAVGSATINNYDGCATMAVTASNYPAHFLARGPAGSGIPVQFFKVGDSSKKSNPSEPMRGENLGAWDPLTGFTYMAPMQVIPFDHLAVANKGSIRGQMRGFWMICSRTANYTDGQTFIGGGTLAGKVFRVVKNGVNGDSIIGMEVSNTLDTN